jgi:hypothetical protein
LRSFLIDWQCCRFESPPFRWRRWRRERRKPCPPALGNFGAPSSARCKVPVTTSENQPGSPKAKSPQSYWLIPELFACPDSFVELECQEMIPSQEALVHGVRIPLSPIQSITAPPRAPLALASLCVGKQAVGWTTPFGKSAMGIEKAVWARLETSGLKNRGTTWDRASDGLKSDPPPFSIRQNQMRELPGGPLLPAGQGGRGA